MMPYILWGLMWIQIVINGCQSLPPAGKQLKVVDKNVIMSTGTKAEAVFFSEKKLKYRMVIYGTVCKLNIQRVYP